MGSIFKPAVLSGNYRICIPVLTMYRSYYNHQMPIFDFYHRTMVSIRIGATTNEPHQCRCGSSVDRQGHHGLSCRRSAGRQSRHASLNDIIRRALATVNVPAILEPNGIARDDGKRPDGMSLIPWSRGRPLVWDATCVDTLAASHVLSTSKTAGAAATAAEALKRRKYASLGNGYIFLPFGVETLGPWGPEAWLLFKELSKRLVDVTHDQRAGAYLGQRISLAIQRGKKIPEHEIPLLKKKHPNIEKVDHHRLQCALQILQKFGITPFEACQNLHIFSMNPITVDNYGEILRECGFINILPKHIIKYHTIAKHSTIASLKKQGVMKNDVELEEALLDSLKAWPTKDKTLIGFSESTSSILTIRTSVLERYLKWRLSITTEEFEKYLRNYLPLRHKPMADIKEALDLAQDEIKFDMKAIRRNGFIVAADPTSTKLMLENVSTIAGLDVREAIRQEPAIMKNNYNALLEIRSLLEEYRIPEEFQSRCLRVYCMRPGTVKERLEELRNMKEYRVLSTNPRVLTLVVHKKKMMNRIIKIQTAKKQCYSLNHLISSSKVFNNYISNFGSKACGRDIGTLINSTLNTNKSSEKVEHKTILKQLRKHKYWLHVSLNTVDENIQFLKKNFDDAVILNNTQLLLYPVSEIGRYTDIFLKMRRHQDRLEKEMDIIYHSLNHEMFTDDQILSLVLYEIEKKYHFSGDGIWARLDGNKTEGMARN